MGEKKRQKKKYGIELTGASMFLWGGLFLFLIVWAFILGIFVGEGLLPEKEFRPKKEKNIIQEAKEETEPEFSFHKRLTAPQPETKKKNNIPKKQNTFKARGCYSVQIAAFLKEKDAQDMVRRLKRRKYDVYYTKTIKDNKTYYRVRCGRLDRKKAELLKKKLLRQEHIKGIIVRCR